MKKQYDPYAQMTDMNGIAPVMQDTSGQSSMMQSNMSTLGNLAKAAYNPKGDVAPYDPSAMAKILRSSKEEANAPQPAPVYDYSQPMPNGMPNTQPNALPATDPYQEMMKKYYGNTYDPNAGWSD